MKQVYWTTKKARSIKRFENYDKRWEEYSPIKNKWNEELFKNYSLAKILFGTEIKDRIEQLHNEMRKSHSHLVSIRKKDENEVEASRQYIKEHLNKATADLQQLITDIFTITINESE